MDNNCNAGNKIDMNYKRHIVCLDGLAGCYFQNNTSTNCLSVHQTVVKFNFGHIFDLNTMKKSK